MKNLILIGFRGTGKSTLSEELAIRSGRICISTDDMATKRCGMSISDFVKKYDWTEFRHIEQECIVRLREKENIIIDCGGGVVENAENMRLLGENGLIVWVHASLEDVLVRLLANEHDAQRPLLSQSDFRSDISENYIRREPLYKHYAAFSVNTSTHTIAQCCDAIEQLIAPPQLSL